MSLKDLAWDVGALAAVFAIGVGVGYVRGDHVGTADMLTKVTAAQKAQSLAEGQARNSDSALAQIKDRLAAQKEQADHLRLIAAAALDQRDAARDRLAHLTKQRIAAVENLAHESPDCRALDRLPVCPAIAQRLFQPGSAPRAAALGGGGAQPRVPADTAPAH